MTWDPSSSRRVCSNWLAESAAWLEVRLRELGPDRYKGPEGWALHRAMLEVSKAAAYAARHASEMGFEQAAEDRTEEATELVRRAIEAVADDIDLRPGQRRSLGPAIRRWLATEQGRPIPAKLRRKRAVNPRKPKRAGREHMSSIVGRPPKGTEELRRASARAAVEAERELPDLDHEPPPRREPVRTQHLTDDGGPVDDVQYGRWSPN